MSEVNTQSWEAIAKLGNLDDAIEAYVLEKDHVSFAELMKHLGPYAELSGRHALCTTSDPNIILWADMSQAFIDAVRSLLADGRIHCQEASQLTYMIDGAMLSMPIAIRAPKGGYKEEHWAVVCLRPGKSGA